MHTVKTLDGFISTTNEDIEAAIDRLEDEPNNETGNDDSLGDDPILVELDRLIEGYFAVFETRMEEEDAVPEDILQYTPEHPIEQAAFDIFVDTLCETDEDEDEETP